MLFTGAPPTRRRDAFLHSRTPLLALLLLACDGKGGDSGAPDFNYIPLTDGTCQPASLDELADAESLVDTLASQQVLVGERFSLCDESSCAPCSAADNPILSAVREADQWGSAELQAAMASVAYLQSEDASAESALEVYFDRALAFPYRYLLFAIPGSDDHLTLAQGVRQSCADGGAGCWDFKVGIRSLDDTCDQFLLELPEVTVARGGDGGATSLSTDAPGEEAFGFAVPLREELPDPTDLASVEAIQAEAGSGLTAAVNLEQPTVALDWDGERGCATLRGQVPVSALSAYASDPALLDAYATGGFIEAALSLDLTDATVQPWSDR